jgi:hypothetical protein
MVPRLKSHRESAIPEKRNPGFREKPLKQKARAVV